MIFSTWSNSGSKQVCVQRKRIWHSLWYHCQSWFRRSHVQCSPVKLSVPFCSSFCISFRFMCLICTPKRVSYLEGTIPTYLTVEEDASIITPLLHIFTFHTTDSRDKYFFHLCVKLQKKFPFKEILRSNFWTIVRVNKNDYMSLNYLS